ncbi:MAG: winged helix-turn-helix transcriptional regulator [Deltaproteobacteria bacterium]|nr:winged helix-turn-helix transcriptional regulator [Deltaproteobacteria bacterium]
MAKEGRGVATDVARAAQVAEILKAVAHPLRLRIVAVLCKGDITVNALAERLGAGQAIVSQQLRILRMHRLVVAVRQHGHASYRLLEPRLRDLVTCVEGCAHSMR